MERTIRDNYFIGLTLPGDVSSRIEKEREWMRQTWGNRSGMGTVPHITLIPPFYSNLSVKALLPILSSIKSERIDAVISGHGSFGGRTIYAFVEENKEMNELQGKLKRVLRENDIPFKDEKKFTPHITIANRDIKPESFVPSMVYFESLNLHEEFVLSSFTLFSFIDYRWRVTGEIRFSS